MFVFSRYLWGCRQSCGESSKDHINTCMWKQRFRVAPGHHCSISSFWTFDRQLFSKIKEPESTMKGAGTIRWLKWELSECETCDLRDCKLMLLRNIKAITGGFWGHFMPCWRAVKGVLNYSGPLHQVSNPWHQQEKALFGLSRLH